MRKSRIIVDIIVLFALLFWFSRSCWAEQVYVITEKELTTLENRFQVVKSNNTLLQSKLEKLNNKLVTLEALSQTQETQLATLNKSFKEYAQEERKKLNRVKLERTVLGVIAGGLLYALVVR